MASWEAVEAAAPELAARVLGRFEATGLGYLASVRRDGSPRLSGVEPGFRLGELWLGMMAGSRKADDLRRDARLALHAANVDKEVAAGDAKVGGRAVEVVDRPTLERFVGTLDAEPPGDMALFRVDVTELSFLIPVVDHLEISWWNEVDGLRSLDRY